MNFFSRKSSSSSTSSSRIETETAEIIHSHRSANSVSLRNLPKAREAIDE